jgi:protein O-mannosyl-transferase
MGSVPVMARPRLLVWLMAILLVLVTIAVYWPATRCDFVNYDDQDYVTENLHVQGGLNREGLKWAFLNPVSANWHPLTMLSHMLDCQLFGLNPWGHHLINVLFHSLNVALVFLLLRHLTGAIWRSLMVAAVFAIHPLHVESVAWVSERKDVLSGFFGLLSLIAYVRHVRKPEVRSQKSRTNLPASWVFFLSPFYWLSLFFLALGLMSKPMLVTWPFVLLLLDYWPLERFKRSRVWLLMMEKIPFFVLAAAASVVTFLVQKQGGSLVENLPLGARIGNALISYCCYLGKMFWPTNLAVFYPHPGYWPRVNVLLAGVFLCGISVLFFVKRGRYPFLLMGWLWFAGTLVPMIGLVQTGMQAMADRHTYLPSLGVLILTIWGVYELTRGWRYHQIALSAAGSAAIVLCIAATRQQIGYWKDSETLFRHALAVTENSYIAHENLGMTLVKKGQIGEAIIQLREAIRLKPDFAEAHYNLGTTLAKNGQTDEAIIQFQEAIRLKPDDAEARNNLGAVLLKDQTDEAIIQFQKAIRIKPDDAKAHNNLGIALGRNGQIDEAISQYREAIRLKPDDAALHYNLGNAFLKKGQTEEAISEYQEAIRLKPDYADAHNNLARALEIKNIPAGR